MHESRFRRAAKARPEGFTLIEVMITVAIVAILASVAYPAYTDYVRRGQLQEAFTNLANYRIRMEQYYQDNRRYTANVADVNCAGAANPALTATELGGRIDNFTYTCVAANNGQTYTLTAVGSGGSVTGYDYTINENGAQGTSKFAGANAALGCWASRSAAC